MNINKQRFKIKQRVSKIRKGEQTKRKNSMKGEMKLNNEREKEGRRRKRKRTYSIGIPWHVKSHLCINSFYSTLSSHRSMIVPD